MSYQSLSVQTNARSNAIRANLNSVNLAPDSKPWLLQNLDPFHDSQFSMGAPPTQSQIDSTVQIRRARFTLKPGLATDGSCRGNLSIFVPPVVQDASLTALLTTGDTTRSAGYGGIMVADYSGDDDDPQYLSLSSFSPPADGAWRVVGFGYELTNTTPTMYQSGSLLTYQSPTGLYHSAATPLIEVELGEPATSTLAVHGAVSGLAVPAPSTVDEATALPTAKQWDAKHGAYVIPRLT